MHQTATDSSPMTCNIKEMAFNAEIRLPNLIRCVSRGNDHGRVDIARYSDAHGNSSQFWFHLAPKFGWDCSFVITGPWEVSDFESQVLEMVDCRVKKKAPPKFEGIALAIQRTGSKLAITAEGQQVLLGQGPNSPTYADSHQCLITSKMFALLSHTIGLWETPEEFFLGTPHNVSNHCFAPSRIDSYAHCIEDVDHILAFFEASLALAETEVGHQLLNKILAFNMRVKEDCLARWVTCQNCPEQYLLQSLRELRWRKQCLQCYFDSEKRSSGFPKKSWAHGRKVMGRTHFLH